MADREDPKNKIIQLMSTALPTDESQPKPARKRRSRPASHVEVNGHGNIVGNGNTVIKTEKVTHKTIVEPKPGAEHITEEQVARLKERVAEIVAFENASKRDPASFQRVYTALNRSMKVGAVRMIPLDRYNDAEKYLNTWIGRLMDSKTAQKNEPDLVRKKRITYIQTNMKKLGIETKVRDYMQKKFVVTSLSDLHDQADLEAVYRYVAGLKNNLS